MFGWDNKGEIVWSVMILLLLLSLGTLHITGQQRQLARMNHWHDMSLRMSRQVDRALARMTRVPGQFPMEGSTWRDVNTWPKASVSAWRSEPAAWHMKDATGMEVHVVWETLRAAPDFFRLNALGYHSSGALLIKQWVVRCQENDCQRLSQREME